jgi:hypothetical protein
MPISNIDALKISDLKPGDFIRSVVASKVHKVTKVNAFWGSFTAIGPGGRSRNYTINPGGSKAFVKLSPVEKADFILQLENAGITSYWRED